MTPLPSVAIRMRSGKMYVGVINSYVSYEPSEGYLLMIQTNDGKTFSIGQADFQCHVEEPVMEINRAIADPNRHTVQLK